MIGLFIGSFNPITKAHIDIILKVKDNFKKIVLVPVSSKDKELIDINRRIEMLNILKKKYSFIEISNIMKNYSYLYYYIIDLLKNKYGDLNIIMGSDLLEKLPSFDNYEYLLDNYNFTIISRDNINLDKLIKERYLKYQNKFTILNYQSNISSTMVRKLLKEKKDISDVLDKDIYDYIKKNNLY